MRLGPGHGSDQSSDFYSDKAKNKAFSSSISKMLRQCVGKKKKKKCVSPLFSDYKSSSLKESLGFIDQKAPQSCAGSPGCSGHQAIDQKSDGSSETLSGDTWPQCSRTACCGRRAKNEWHPHNRREASRSDRKSLGETSRRVTTGKFVFTLFTFDGTSTLWGLSVTSSERGEGREES